MTKLQDAKNAALDLARVLENVIGLAQDGEQYLTRIAEHLEAHGGAPRTRPSARVKPALLLVDDHAPLRAYLARALGRSFVMTTADGLKAARRILLCRPFDAVVTDFHLRDGSGLEVLKAAQRQQPQMARVIYTAARDAKIVARHRQSGVVHGVLQKPLTATAVHRQVAALLAGELGSAGPG